MKLHGLSISTKRQREKDAAAKSDSRPVTATGSCLCGKVTYSVRCALNKEVRPCHCTQCRKQSGHHAAYVQVERWDAVEIKGEENVTWYAASEDARRGFCKTCGSQLFWVPDPEKTGRISGDVSGGTLDTHTDIKVGAHIFVADKGDYYDLGGDVPLYDAYPAKGDNS